jgi:acyl carrier protein
MKKIDFITELKELLEIEGELLETTPLYLTSLSTLTLIVFLDENFNKRVKAADLKNITTIRDLISLIGSELIT